MESDDGFDAFGEEIKSDPFLVLLAKWRRDAFIARLESLPDVIEVIPTGSLARGTFIGNVKDIDLIVVFDRSAHPDYGSGPESAEGALAYLEGKLVELLHPVSGTEALIKGTRQRTHVVTCDGGWTGPYAGIISPAPPVDVMPAVREQPSLLERSHLLVPKLARDGSGRVIPGKGEWEDVDPATFMRQVEQRQREWRYFTEVIQLVKAWARQEGLEMKSVAIEAMVLKYCPRPRMFETLSRGEAIARFFGAAGKAHITSLKDPAGRCGEIDRDMDFGRLRRKLKDAAGLARQAMDAEYRWKDRRHLMQDATHPDVFWRLLFGKQYPEAPEPFWRAPAWEPWSDGSWRRPRNDGPNGPDDLNPHGPGGSGPNGPGGPGPSGPGGPGPLGPGGPGPSGPGRSGSGDRGPNGPGDLWEGVLGPAAGTPAVPLTYGGDGPPGGSGPGSPTLYPGRRRYLEGRCPESVAVGEPFSLLVSIVLAAGPCRTELEGFDVPPEGRDVLVSAHAPGLRLLDGQRRVVHVPAEQDSRPVIFGLRADDTGPWRVSVTAWIDGSYIGELVVEITAERNRPHGPHQEVRAEIAAEPAEGAVSLVVRYDPVQNAYRFEFRDEDNPDEVQASLAYDPGPLVEQLLAELDDLARGRSGYSAAQARDYMMKAGARLWRQLVPAQLREQFWDRQHRIRQLVILADRDVVPWELLYPIDPGHDAGFLVEQFP